MRSAPRLALAALALLAACTDRLPTAPDPAAGPEPTTQRFECMARVRDLTVTCAARAPLSSQARGAILGGQGQYVRLTSSNVAFNAGTGTFSFDETVQNLLPSAMGTLDGVNPDPAGIRVFFHTGPTVTSGWGTVTVQNPDGVGAFTASSQPYFQYPGILAPGQTSAARTWLFHVDPDVAFFVFTLYVSTHTAPTLVVSEIMAHPSTASEAAGEWFEVHNRSNDPVDLQGWTIASGGDAPHTISTSLVVPAHGFLVLGGSADPTANGQTPVNYVYTGIDLANGTTDWLALRSPAGFTADSVDWGAAPAETASPPPTGLSLELDSLQHDNTWLSGASSHWAPSIATYGSGQHGTPGARTAVALNAVSISAARVHTCAVDTAGQAWCWGNGFAGRMGNGPTDVLDETIYPSPVRVAQPAGVVFTQVVATEYTTCALATTGQAYCWGWYVPLGTSEGTRTTPTPVPQHGVTFTALSKSAERFGNDRTACGIDASGQVWCWGTNRYSATLEPSPPGGAVAEVVNDANQNYCARTAAGALYCRWESDLPGGDSLHLVQQPGVTWQHFDMHGGYVCAVSTIGQLFCWVNSPASPSMVPHPPTVRFTDVSVGNHINGYLGDHVCAVATTGQAYCFGSNLYGEVGDGTTRPRYDLTPVAQSGVLFAKVSAGWTHTCAPQQGTGQVYCWGDNTFGQVGDGTTTPRLVPVPVFR